MEIIDFIMSLTLFGAWWAFSGAVVVWFYCLFASENEENGWIASIATAVFLGLLYYKSNVNPLPYFTLLNVLLYVGVGFVYSLIKTYFYSRAGGYKSELKEHVFRWWGLWPVSLLYWIFSDLLKDLYDVVYSKISVVYDKIFEFGKKDKEEK